MKMTHFSVSEIFSGPSAICCRYAVAIFLSKRVPMKLHKLARQAVTSLNKSLAILEWSTNAIIDHRPRRNGELKEIKGVNRLGEIKSAIYI